jgi:hypothetical protein
MLRKVALIAVGVLLLGVSSPRADEAVLDQLYGNGVHSYFGGDYSRAYETLSTTIRGGSHDPRVYYFRALAELRLGREPDATADFEKGAALEAADANGRYYVSQALERIQGSTRATLEQYRENARAVAMQRDVQNRQSVFDQQRSTEGQLLRRALRPAELTPAPAPDGAVVKLPPAEAKDPAAAKAGPDSDPFKTGPAKPADVAADKTTAEKPIEAADPFGGDAGKKPPVDPAAKPVEKSAEAADPFGGDAKPAEKPAAKAAEKPTDKAPDASDPFGGDAKPAEKPAEKPADKPAAAPDAKASAAAADASAVKPQPGAVRGIFKALISSAPSGDASPPAQGAPVSKAAAIPKSAAPPAGADDPFAAPPVASKKPLSTPADAPPAVDPSAPASPAPAPPAGAKKAADPFADEPPAKAAPDAKSPAPADKSAPEMKKDDNPSKL